MLFVNAMKINNNNYFSQFSRIISIAHKMEAKKKVSTRFLLSLLFSYCANIDIFRIPTRIACMSVGILKNSQATLTQTHTDHHVCVCVCV